MKKYEIDMCSGPLLKKILMFSVPLMISGALQLLFNAADIIVVGRCGGSPALAAVGSTGSLINLIINLFMGFSIGVSVVVAQNIGAKKLEDVHEAVQTAIVLSVLCGVLVGIVGVIFARPLLELMGSPADVIDKAAIYIKIYFTGAPAMMLYNFGAAVLRATGDTKRPLYFLSVAGVVNVLLNLFFVVVAGLDVAGVALATVISQSISAALIILCLSKLENSCRLELESFRLHGDKLWQIVKVGLPAGLQGCVFSFSNVLIQSSINSFGSAAMAGNSAASNICDFIYITMNAVYQSALAFTSQNVGAKKLDRLNRVCASSLLIVVADGILLGGLVMIFGRTLIGIYTKDPAVIEIGMKRLMMFGSCYFLCGIMDVMCGEIRGMGASFVSMVVSTIGACGLRIVWIYSVFASFRTLEVLYISYPVTWVITACAHAICYFVIKKRLVKKSEISYDPKAVNHA